MKTLLLALALAGPVQATDLHYAPVYTSSGTEGVLIRIGSFRHNAIAGLDVLYCTIENTTSVTVMCVVRTTQDRLLLVEMKATEHKT